MNRKVLTSITVALIMVMAINLPTINAQSATTCVCDSNSAGGSDFEGSEGENDFNSDKGEDDITHIDKPAAPKKTKQPARYTLDGRKIDKQNRYTLYIYKGKKVLKKK